MASEAQMIMTLSMKKIVESRSRRGGASLHRNLLVAGVLFKARDVLLAESVDTVDSSENPPTSDDSVDRKSCEDEKMECERTVGELGGKENVPPSNQPTPDHPHCDNVEPPTDKARALKRMSRDVADDDVTPCKTTRADTTTVDDETVTDIADDDDNELGPSSHVCLSSSRPVLSSVVRRLSLPCLDSRLTPNVADPSLVRPLLVVQVV